MPRGRPEPAGSRFWLYVSPEPNSGCWLWTGSCDRKGYGQIRLDQKTLKYATHVALELAGRPVPQGLMACHRCDVPCCVNPDHLFVGTARDNTHDAKRKGRLSKPPRTKVGTGLKQACQRGHPLSGDNLILVTGARQCRACNRLRKAARRAQFIAKGLRCDGVPRKA